MAVRIIKSTGNNDFAFLQCTTNYPSTLDDANLKAMQTMREKFKIVVGYSDHTPDLVNPVAATAIGAKVYEKHFTFDKTLPGPDHRMSLESEELKKTVKAIRDTEEALGSSEKGVLEVEEENRTKLRKSLVSITDINKNQITHR